MRHAAVGFDETQGLGVEHLLMWGSVAMAILSWSAARRRYGPDRKRTGANRAETAGFKLIHNKYYVDEIYQATVIEGVLRLRLVLRDMDRWVIEGLVNGVAWVTRASAFISGVIDKYLVDGAVNLVAAVTLRVGSRLRRVQTGRIQSYVYGLLGGVAALALIQFLIRYYGSW